jgi:predicted metal-dependent RNase
MQLSFFGAAQTVTGSKHLITLKKGRRILLDCGMFQGMGPEGDELNRHFGFDPSTVDYLILSHAPALFSALRQPMIYVPLCSKIRLTFRKVMYDI